MNDWVSSRAGSLKKIRRRGEAHYVVGLNGRVYRIIDKSRIATHAGRSYWDGNKVIDNFSIGIEVVGYHNKSITAAQRLAIKELVSQLQRVYAITDERVLTHSMVAYGSPNRWHRRSHRGRPRSSCCHSNQSHPRSCRSPRRCVSRRARRARTGRPRCGQPRAWSNHIRRTRRR